MKQSENPWFNSQTAAVQFYLTRIFYSGTVDSCVYYVAAEPEPPLPKIFKQMTPLPRSSFHLSLYKYVSLLVVLSVSTAGQLTDIATITAPPASPSSPSYLSPAEFRHAILGRSNAYRRRHNARPPVWNEYLANYGRSWGRKCIWKHSVGFPGNPRTYAPANNSRMAPMAKISPTATPTPQQL